MATINFPDSDAGSTRPYGYAYQATRTTAGSTIVGVPTDVHKIGIQVTFTSGSYFVEASMSTQAEIEADSATWYDLVGDGSAAQTASQQFSIDGTAKAVRLRSISGTQKFDVTMRRV